ncbi:hypothetical protein MROS_0985 [Melioribacter roseus P3M-2]|uniref:Uncharacterized protein n=1 Tax=Melioribacter roseus (strain DSM 23840 / JCM 17771 / VKM B-2668 / P3M-2) TaxID=1191523 RepID=I7A2S0_MELRP|nr:SIR2 family protein [Melioribacter roseus]AFN74226.1 hypothetical protein MROS_0985 [Melioribacter roseus P3M-2]
MLVEKFIKYPPGRDVVFVLGAGASNPDGVPLQKELLPQILNPALDEIRNSTIGKVVIEFIEENFQFDRELNLYPRLEAVFGFIDYFIQHNESLNSKYNVARIREIREYLIKLIHYIVNLNTDKKSHYYHLFWKNIVDNVPNSSIITLNYDTLLEQAFETNDENESFFNKNFYLDYCMHFMNYEKIPQLKEYHYWINPREPLLLEESIEPKAFKIIKLHGSLNWKYCSCCNQTLLTTWDRKIDLNRGKFLGYTHPDKVEYEYRCPIDGTDFETLIMPPSYLKSLHHPVISQLLVEASKEIRAADKIVFIGYSLSESDLHIKALFKKNIRPGAELIVINPKKKESLELNYKSLAEKVRFVNMTFEGLIEKGFFSEFMP